MGTVPRMDTKRTLTLFATTVLTLLMTALPVLAAEPPDEKSQLITRSAHHIVGSMILLVVSLFVVMAVANAIQQLRGERRQADGKFRWR
jgi:hypothetical protein